MDFSVLQEKLNYSFHNIDLLYLALTHSSYLNREMTEQAHNQRLEFLGDAVLQLYSSILLYQHFPDANESSLSQARAFLVCEGSLAKFARQIDLGSFLFLGKSEEMTGGRNRESILADAMEAVIGAIYLDGGETAASYFIQNLLNEDLDNSIIPEHRLDVKTTLQLRYADEGIVDYKIISESGPDHAKVFVAGAYLKDRLLATGSGATKKIAQRNAASAALQKFNPGKEQ